MSDSSLPDAVATELETHEAFERTDGGFSLETTVFDATVTASDADGKRDGAFTVTVTMPTLGAASVDEVAPIVETDWYETLERRLQDAFTVAHTSTADEPRLEREDGEVTVTLEYVAWDAQEGVEDAKAVIEFVEGTYAQGIVPGYEYRGEAAALLESAQRRGQDAADGERGGMPM